MKRSGVFFGVIFLLLSCKETVARRPITQKTSTSTKSLVAASKKLHTLENKKIEHFISLDSLHAYKVSSKGFWYYYNHQVLDSLPRPKLADEVVISYDIRNLQGDTIYKKEVLGIKQYKVDKEDFILGLQDGIKLMKKGETITFVIPSYRAFGLTGDGNKIGINQSIISTLTLIDIK